MADAAEVVVGDAVPALGGEDVPGQLVHAGPRSLEATKWRYAALFALSSVLCWILRDYGGAVALRGREECEKATAAAQSVCARREAMFRLAAATALFFAGHLALVALLAAIRQYDAAKRWHTGWFTIKLVIWSVLVVVCMLALRWPLFRAFFQFARVAAAVCLFLQLVIFLETALKVDEALVDRRECRFTLVLATSMFLVWVLGCTAWQYLAFAPSADCEQNIAFITITLILCIVVTLLSLAPNTLRSAGLFTSMVIAAYAVFLCASALVSGPTDTRCSKLVDTGDRPWLTVVSSLITLAALVVACGTTASSHNDFWGLSVSGGGGASAAVDGDLDKGTFVSEAVFLHGTFLCATCYMLMVLSNWELTGTPGRFRIDRGPASMWMKMATQWFSFGLYAWALIAPALMPDRFQ